MGAQLPDRHSFPVKDKIRISDRFGLNAPVKCRESIIGGFRYSRYDRTLFKVDSGFPKIFRNIKILRYGLVLDFSIVFLRYGSCSHAYGI